MVAVGVLALAVHLAWSPLLSWWETRGQVAERRSEVEALREEKEQLSAELASTLSVETLARDARAIGQVRPGEQLFIVRGIDAWRAAYED